MARTCIDERMINISVLGSFNSFASQDHWDFPKIEELRLLLGCRFVLEPNNLDLKYLVSRPITLILLFSIM